MQRLKSREKQIPGGYFYRIAALNWDSKRVLGLHPSFSTLVSAVISARKANPHHAAKNKWSLDRATVEMEVEAFQVRVCQSQGWLNYVADAGGGGAVPLARPQTAEESKQLAAAATKAKLLWSGIRATKEWKDSNEPPVSRELANERAKTCSECPQNKRGDWTNWFTAPAAASVKRYIEWIQGKKLSTDYDYKLQVCDVCLCPLAYKLWMPLKFIKAETSSETLQSLRDKGRNCWIPKELESETG